MARTDVIMEIAAAAGRQLDLLADCSIIRGPKCRPLRRPLRLDALLQRLDACGIEKQTRCEEAEQPECGACENAERRSEREWKSHAKILGQFASHCASQVAQFFTLFGVSAPGSREAVAGSSRRIRNSNGPPQAMAQARYPRTVEAPR